MSSSPARDTRASAVYFAGRAHTVRIRVKKLRYALEVATTTHQWTPPHMLNDLELPARERLADVAAAEVSRDLQVVGVNLTGGSGYAELLTSSRLIHS